MADRLQKLLDSKLQTGAFYDAHQVIRAIFERFSRKPNVLAAVEWAATYRDVFAKHEQYELVADLGSRTLKLMRSGKEVPEEADLESLRLFFTACNNNSCRAAYGFMNDLIGWSKKLYEGGSPSLHEELGTAYRLNGRFGAAWKHYVFAGSAMLLQQLLSEWKKACYYHERELLFCRSVLMLHAAGKSELAQEVVGGYCDWDADGVHPAAQIAYLATGALLAKDSAFIDRIKSKYALVLRMDADLPRLLDAGCNKVFGVQATRDPLGNILGQLLSGLGTAK